MALSTFDNNFRGVIGNKVHFKKNNKYWARSRRNKINASQTEEAVEHRLKF